MMHNVVEAFRQPLQRTLRSLIAGDGTEAGDRISPRVDDGYFGPRSVTWRVHTQSSMLVGGVRALLYQTAHPLAMAGVAEHSNYRHDPLGRLHRTATYLGATTYGDTPTAEAAIARVRRVHRDIKGIAPDGRPYRATDPHLLGWVHATEVDSFLAAHQRYASRPLDEDEADRYVDEMAVIARKLGVRRPPRSVLQLTETLAKYDDELEVGPRRAPPCASSPFHGPCLWPPGPPTA